MSPARLTRRAAVSGAAAAAVPFLLARRAAAAAEAEGDTAIVVSALGLEQVSTFAYRALARSPALPERERRLVRRFARHEQEHADALLIALDALGGDAPPPPRTVKDVDRILPGLATARTREDVLTFAVELESAAVAAYGDAHAKLEEPKLLQTVASIMGNEAQHLAVLRGALDMEPVPGAFETGER